MRQLFALAGEVTDQLSADPITTLTLISRRLPDSARLGLLSATEIKKVPAEVHDLALRLADIHGEADRAENNVLFEKESARELWAKGNVTAAIQKATGRLKHRYQDECEVITGRAFPKQSVTGQPNTPDTTDLLYILTNSLPTTISGYSCRTHSLLTAMSRQGYSAAGVTRPGYPASIGRWSPTGIDVVDGVTYIRDIPWHTPPLMSRKLDHRANQLSKLVARLRPAVLQATSDWENGIPTRSVARAHKIPWVYEMRGEREKTWVAQFPAEEQLSAEQSERYRWIRATETSLAQDADAVVVLSEVQKEQLIERRVPERRIHVIPNGADSHLPKVQVEAASCRNMLGLPQGFIFGTVTSVVDYEGLDLLIQCLPNLLKQDINAYLLIVGTGSALPTLRRKATELEIEDRCFFPGQVSPESAHLWYRCLDVFCLPRKRTSVTEIVTPMKSLPATALGIPVISSDLPALREVVPSAEIGTLLPPGAVEKWGTALEEHARGITDFNRASALQFVEKRTWDSLAKSMIDIHNKIQRENK